MSTKSFIVSYAIPDAWEVWHIDLTDEGQVAFDAEVGEDHTPAEAEEWLNANPDLWDYFDLKDRGGFNMEDFTMEEELE